MAKPPVSEQVQVNFRMPVNLRDRIKAAAEVNNRSMNAEIVAALDSAYPEEEIGLGEAYSRWEEMSRGIELMTNDQKLTLVEKFRRAVSSSGLSVALSGGILKIISTTTPPYAAEMSIPIFEGADEILKAMARLGKGDLS